MTTRKATHPLSPTSTSTVRTITSAMASEHAEAIQTLNEQTMKQACEWLIDDSEESEDKLLEAYYKCESAWKVLQRHQHLHQHLQTPISPLPPGAPNLIVSAISNNNANNNATLGRTALQPRPLPKLGLGSVSAATSGATSNTPAGAGGTGNSNSTMKVAKGGVIPMRRTAPMPKVSRMRSTEASPLSSSDALIDAATQNKKARLDNARAPPPSALHFLAKLNKDGATTTTGGTSTTPSPSTGPSPPTTTNTTQRNNPPPMKAQLHRRSSS